MTRNRKLSLLVIAITLVLLGSFLFIQAGRTSDQKHVWGGLNPAVFAAETSDDCSEVYELYREFLIEQGFVERSDEKLFKYLPSRIYPNSTQDWYLRDFGKEKILLQVDVSENGFFPYMR